MPKKLPKYPSRKQRKTIFTVLARIEQLGGKPHPITITEAEKFAKEYGLLRDYNVRDTRFRSWLNRTTISEIQLNHYSHIKKNRAKQYQNILEMK